MLSCKYPMYRLYKELAISMFKYGLLWNTRKK